jgi:hypothetical protein
MTRRSPPTRAKKHKPTNTTTSSQPPARTVIIVGATFLILFAWLHLILSLQIASTGRQIQITKEKMEQIERDNLAIVRDIAAAESQKKMADRATALGYGPQAPLYLPLDQPLSMTNDPDTQDQPGPASGSSDSRSLSQFLLNRALYKTSSSGTTSTP